jgi:glycosyltransferase involved in cell wall biosynthesis
MDQKTPSGTASTVMVSVILPTYNRSYSLPDAINSVLTQSCRDLELIVVDDCSTEDIESLVRAFGDSRVRYIKRARNGGAAAARNTGLAEARGQYIAFQDSDDLWLPRKLERQLALFQTLPVDVGVVTGGKLLYGRDARFNFGHGKVVYAPSPASVLKLDEDQVGHLLTENRLSLQNALFKRSCVPYDVWFDANAKANEDWDFAIRLVQKTRMYEDLQPVVVGFMSPDSISSSARRQTIGVLRILKKNRALLGHYRKQRSVLMMDVAVELLRQGKGRRALGFLGESLKDRPANIFVLPGIAARKAKKMLVKGWHTLRMKRVSTSAMTLDRQWQVGRRPGS